jgi:hypothetical protein
MARRKGVGHSGVVPEPARTCHCAVRGREDPGAGPGPDTADSAAAARSAGAERTNDYERHGTTSLFAALDIATGKVIAKCHHRHRHQEFLKFMNAADSAIPPDAGEVHLVLDNYGTHKTPSVVRWFARHPRYQLHFTRPTAPG